MAGGVGGGARHGASRMPSLIWSADALSDVQRLYRFLESKNKPAAKRAIKTIRKAVSWLTTYPHLGKPAPNLGPEYRGLTVLFGGEGYVVLYAEKNALVTILSVKHQREFTP